MTNQKEIPSGSFVYYESFDSVFHLLDDAEELTVRRALSTFAFTGDIPDLSERERYAFEAIAPQIQANKVKRSNGKKGGRPKANKDDNGAENMDAAPTPARAPKPNPAGLPAVETTGFLDEETTTETTGFSEGITSKKPNVNVNVNVNGTVNGNVNGGAGGNPLAPNAPDGAVAADAAGESDPADARRPDAPDAAGVETPLRDPAPPEADANAKPKRRRRSSVLAKVSQERFDRWYAVYPKHSGRAYAEKAWKKLDPDDEFTDELISAVKAQCAGRWNGQDRRYIPDPSTWLNGGRWEDDSSPQTGILQFGRGSGPSGGLCDTDWSAELASLEADSDDYPEGEVSSCDT